MAANQGVEDGIITKDIAEQLVPPAPSNGRAYGMPKAHKEVEEGKSIPPLRLVISGCGSNTEPASHFLDFHAKEIPKKLDSFIEDTPHLLRTLEELNENKVQPATSIPVSIDVEALYPSIPIDEGMKCFEEYVKDPMYRDQSLPWEFLMVLLNFVLKCNTFVFNGKTFLQQWGTAIGTKAAPVFANIFMGVLEKKILRDWKGRPPDLWKRYIDDIFTIWSGTEDELLKFLNFINSYHRTIKFTAEYRTSQHVVKVKWKDGSLCVKREPLLNLVPRSIDFLDTTISINNEGKFMTDLYVKSSDRITYLMPQSSHPRHIHQNIPYSLSYRLKRIVSCENTYLKRLEELRNNLLTRGYCNKVIDMSFNKVAQISRKEALKMVTRPVKNSVILALTYDPRIPDASKVVKKHFVLA